jgi:hypothetical protein
LTDRTTVFATGKVYWAKIVGDKALVQNYERDGREWTVEFVPDDTTFLKDHKLLDRLKDKEDAKNPDKGEFIILRKPEFDKDGEKNDPFRIYDGTGDETRAWDDRLIGNGSSVDAKLSIVDWGKGKKKSIYLTALRVTDLVPYVSNEFGAMDEDRPAAKKATKAKAKAPAAELDDLDDEAPF